MIQRVVVTVLPRKRKRSKFFSRSSSSLKDSVPLKKDLDSFWSYEFSNSIITIPRLYAS